MAEEQKEHYESFVVHKNLIETLDILKDDKRKWELFKEIAGYAFNETGYPDPKNDVEKALLMFAKSGLDSDKIKKEAARKRLDNLPKPNRKKKDKKDKSTSVECDKKSSEIPSKSTSVEHSENDIKIPFKKSAENTDNTRLSEDSLDCTYGMQMTEHSTDVDLDRTRVYGNGYGYGNGNSITIDINQSKEINTPFTAPSDLPEKSVGTELTEAEDSEEDLTVYEVLSNQTIAQYSQAYLEGMSLRCMPRYIPQEIQDAIRKYVADHIADYKPEQKEDDDDKEADFDTETDTDTEFDTENTETDTADIQIIT